MYEGRSDDAVPKGRSIAEQSADDLGGPGSVLVRQRRDHAELDALLERCRSTTGDEQQDALSETCRLVFSHAFAEEAVLWPAIRRALPDGEALTLRIEREHQQICELVTELEQSRPGDPGRDELLGQVIELLRQDVRDEEDVVLPAQPTVWNHVMHWGTGATLGALRGMWSATGLRGPRASLSHAIVRLATDQTLENATGIGAPPQTWPRSEQTIDVLHKAVYSCVTGWVADRVVPSRLESRMAPTSH